MHAALLGLVTLADIRGTSEVAQGELLRFLAEAAWYPTALLPSQGVRWEALDGISARATLTDGATMVALARSDDIDVPAAHHFLYTAGLSWSHRSSPCGQHFIDRVD